MNPWLIFHWKTKEFHHYCDIFEYTKNYEKYGPPSHITTGVSSKEENISMYKLFVKGKQNVSTYYISLGG